MKYIIKTFILLVFVNQINAQYPGWHLEASDSNDFIGIDATGIYENLLQERPSRTVVVAVIDSGVDVEHEDLSANVWVNADEIPDNGIDDDNNGYIDDVNGWNFIGGSDGTNVHHDTYEATRIYAKYDYKYKNANPNLLSKADKKEYDLYVECRDEVEAKLASAKNNLENVQNVYGAYKNGLETIQMKLDGKVPTQEALEAIDATDDFILQIGKDILLQQIVYGYEIEDLESFKNDVLAQLESDLDYFKNRVEYAYNVDYNPRDIVGDDYEDTDERYYGNPDIEGPDARHGTHVAGIIGAVIGNEIGMDGVANNVRIMSVRTVPDGDERDKDVANAIRYAVDNGASVINMSFGKGYSPQEKVVEDAIKYAEKKDVLLVHAAGNDGKDNDTTNQFPNDMYKGKGFLFFKGKTKNYKNWISVGAISSSNGDYLVAPFSNYGQETVDVFAPGMEIFSTIPNDEYEPLQGTSMAAPVVAGVATVLRSYFPSLTAEQVKNIILASSSKVNSEVIIPGSNEEKVAFSTLSVSGGVVNAREAIKLAMETKGEKKVKKQKSVPDRA